MRRNIVFLGVFLLVHPAAQAQQNAKAAAPAQRPLDHRGKYRHRSRLLWSQAREGTMSDLPFPNSAKACGGFVGIFNVVILLTPIAALAFETPSWDQYVPAPVTGDAELSNPGKPS